MCWDSLDLQPGERVVHLGCGTGYYTAIAAEVVGAGGRVYGIEIDSVLFRHATENLAHFAQVHVEHSDGSSELPTEVDAMFVNAGITNLNGNWLRALALGGRLLVPMTFDDTRSGSNHIGVGRCLRVARTASGYSARFLFNAGIYHCAGARSVEAANALKERFDAGDSDTVRSVRLDRHGRDGMCWLHQDAVCISRAELNVQV